MSVIEPISIIFIVLGLIITIMGVINNKGKVDYLFLGLIILSMAFIFLLEWLFCNNVLIRSKLVLGIAVEVILGSLLLIIGWIRKIKISFNESNLTVASVMFSLAGVILLGLLLGNGYRGSLPAMLVPIVSILSSLLLLFYVREKR